LDVFTDPASWPAQDAVLRSTSISAEVTLDAYRHGLFPMPIGEPGRKPWMWWWSPVRRGVLPLDGLRVSKSLRASSKRYTVTVDAAFGKVMTRCADPAREGGWIDERITAVYTELHLRGYAHSVEAWTPEGRLAGGLYGVALGGLFAGESMFHDARIGRDASKVALVGLVERLRAAGDADRRILDVQWRTDHLASLGAQEISRTDYLRRLDAALALPAPDWQRGVERPT
jgi:leucyl/phenylalanyl-tRNA--protein transferase